MKEWSAAGSVLLAGEYRITENSGKGIALAAGGRAHMKIEDSDMLVVNGQMGKEMLNWTPDYRVSNLSIAAEVYSTSGFPGNCRGEAFVDSSEFYGVGGRKWGLGSSAASAVLISRFMNPQITEREKICSIALQAHRKFQGGRGSGYDVLCSAYGGIAMFHGGVNPQWSSLRWPEEIESCLLRGKSRVNSASAVKLFEDWKRRQPKLWDNLKIEMDQHIEDLAGDLGGEMLSDGFFKHIKELTRIGIDIGENIGLAAEPLIPKGLGRDILQGNRSGAAVKCVGAGNELCVLLYYLDALSDAEKNCLKELAKHQLCRPISIEIDGLRNESLQ